MRRSLLVVFAVLTVTYYASPQASAARENPVHRFIQNKSFVIVTDMITDITDSWSLETYKKYANVPAGAEDAVNKSLAYYKRLGAIKDKAVCELKDYVNSKIEDTKNAYWEASYECVGQYPNGPATVAVTVFAYRFSPFWKIKSFVVTSNYFTSPQAQPQKQ